jgi:hypothetical protein
MLLLLAVLAIGSGVACEQAPDPILKIGLIGVFEGPMAGASGIPGREGGPMELSGGILVVAGVYLVVTAAARTARPQLVEHRPASDGQQDRFGRTLDGRAG